MAEPEITREEAAADADDPFQAIISPDTIRRYARTVLALYDRLDVMDALRVLVDITERTYGEGLAQQTVMLECIDRLRSGWSAGDLAKRPGYPSGWCWSRGSGTTYAREPMTPEQAAVMAQ